MRKKPLVFTLVSLLCIVEPLIKILYFKVTTQFDFDVIIQNLLARESFLEVIDFWLIYPLAGLLILKLRKINYYAFMSVLVYIFYSIATYEKYTWPYNSDKPFVYNYVITALSFAVFLYFLLPSTRRPFFDSRVRWWEPMVRYNVYLPCTVSKSDLTFKANVLNISKSGLFIEDHDKVQIGDLLNIYLEAFGIKLNATIEVMNKHTLNNKIGFGARFRLDSIGQNLTVRSLISKIKRSQSEVKVKLKVA
ncbi:MAG: PilZ domain-containing protein [Proteobacteria bacterium]|jgi:hypothetical protein|nr:PilZ domain-containing protein [Pseudomonadota bacterium]